VYTFEEMVYHVFHHWRESADEFLSNKAAKWVADIGHSYLAVRMKELAEEKSFSEKFSNFLRLINYFGEDELASLSETLASWEERLEWEKLKERGDFFAQKNEPEKAIKLYRQALQSGENIALLNNLGIQYMKTNATQEGLSCLTRALALEPTNFEILLAYTEAAIFNGSFSKAEKSLEKAMSINPHHPDIAFLAGEMAYAQKNLPSALEWFEKAMDAAPDVDFYALKAADVHLQMRRFDNALSALKKCARRDMAYFEKEAEIYAASGNFPAAAKAMQDAIDTDVPATVYAKLAGYHRQNYDTDSASEAIQKAIQLDAENNSVRLEHARIKKATGRTRQYQSMLNEILTSFKESYRGEPCT